MGKKGILIAVEGIDGSGKSTQVQLLARFLEKKGYDVLCLKEPTEGKWGRKIREKAAFDGSLTAEEELNLFMRDRMENVAKNIRPALKKGGTVILDRYYFSTMAYQGARGIPVERIRKMNESFAPIPDLVFILTLSPKEGLKRIENRKYKELLFEKEDYLKKVNQLFCSFKGENIFHIDASAPESQVARIIREKVSAFIECRLE